MKSAVIAFSGGLDSTTLVYSLLRSVDRMHAVFFDYGSRHNPVEYAAAQRILERKSKIHLVAIPPGIFKGNSFSPLLDDSLMPHLSYEELAEAEGPSPTVVPFRNAVILSICTAIAQAQEYEAVYIAVHSTDHHNWAYPDCSPEFMGAMANAVYVGTYGKVRLRTPFMWMTKSDIVALAYELKVPVELTRSCYEATQVACGVCPTCVERINAFTSQGLIDPIKYREDPDWYGCVPWPYTKEIE